MHVTDRIMRAKRALGACGTWGHVPPGKFLASDLLRSFWCRFGVKQQEMDDQLRNLVIVFEVKLNARTMVPLCSEAWEKIFLAGYCIRLIVALWS